MRTSAYHVARRRSAAFHRLPPECWAADTAAQEREQRIQVSSWPSSAAATRRMKPSSSSPTTGRERIRARFRLWSHRPGSGRHLCHLRGAAAPPALRSPAEPGPVKGGTTVIAFVEDPDGYKIEADCQERRRYRPGRLSLRCLAVKTTGPRARFHWLRPPLRTRREAPACSGADPPPAGSAPDRLWRCDPRRSRPRWRSR